MRVEVRFEGTSIILTVDPDTPLGKVQKVLCASFRQQFPRCKATLQIDDKTFDEFIQQPFSECSEGAVALVSFDQTDDPFFYDCFDRNPRHAWLR